MKTTGTIIAAGVKAMLVAELTTVDKLKLQLRQAQMANRDMPEFANQFQVIIDNLKLQLEETV
jgi:hypothetical protein